MRTITLAAALCLAASAAGAADLDCGFDGEGGRGALSWRVGGPATLKVDDGGAVPPLSCALPAVGARAFEDGAFPRLVFEFDGTACRDGAASRHRAAPKVVVVVYPAQGERGLLFWRAGEGPVECRTLTLAQAARRASGWPAATPPHGRWIGEPQPPAGPNTPPRPTLTLDPSGRAYGDAGCNGFEATFTRDGGAIRFSGLRRTTEQVCASVVLTETERRTMELLAAVTRWSTGPGGMLVLSTDDGRSLRFIERGK
ncbi:MAG: META domain-containing protein [Rhodospirillales bacterium]|nr:MAG: META domain-containing protein [Rhodospirillales bacterium]